MAMREPTFWILTALASEPRHGYGVIQQATLLSNQRVRLQAGTLYAALDRLTAEGLVEVDRDEVIDGRNRRYYRLTRHGEAALSSETERMHESAAAAAAQLAARRGARDRLRGRLRELGSPGLGQAEPGSGTLGRVAC